MTPRAKKRTALLLGALALMVALGAGAVGLRRAQRGRLESESRAEGLAAHAAGDYDTALKKLGYYVGQRKQDSGARMAVADSRRRVPMDNAKHLLRAADFCKQAAQVKPADPAPL